MINIDEFEKTITDKTIGASIHMVNNEISVI